MPTPDPTAATSKFLTDLEVRAFHSMDLRGFFVYCLHGGVLCREDLLAADSATLPFYTDATDRNLGLIQRTFGNLGDRWEWFGTCPWGIPNLFGPVTMVFRPDVFRGLQDIVVVTGTTPDHGDAWRERAVQNAVLQQAHEPTGRRFTGDLEFAEFSTRNRFLSFAFLDSVIVEPMTIGSSPLQYWVSKILATTGVVARVVEREYADASRPVILQDLAGWVTADVRGAQRAAASGQYNTWYAGLHDFRVKALNTSFERLRQGTADLITRWDRTLKS